jgi:hypothetical protein
MELRVCNVIYLFYYIYLFSILKINVIEKICITYGKEDFHRKSSQVHAAALRVKIHLLYAERAMGLEKEAAFIAQNGP